MTSRTKKAACYIMDTCCRDLTDGQRAGIEETILRLYRQEVLRRIAAHNDSIQEKRTN